MGTRDLGHVVAVADRDRAVGERLEVDGDAGERADLVLPPVAAADRLGLVVGRQEMRPERRPDLAGQGRELRLL